jgi:hypothetical protein
MSGSIQHTLHDAWEPWIAKGEHLETDAKSSPLVVIEMTPDYIKVETKRGKHPNLYYPHLNALWEQRDYVHSANAKRGKGNSLNHLANRVWARAELRADPTNESYYWAVICKREGAEGGLLGSDSDYDAAEGNPLLRQHLKRERARWLVRQKKQEVLQATGSLACEACGFDYAKVYPKLGEEFCEVHHRVALTEGKRRTKLSELAILCSNCHRMIHRTDPMESVETFRKRLSFGRFEQSSSKLK